MTLLFTFPKYTYLADKLLEGTSLQKGEISITRFPDNESNIRFNTSVQDQDIFILCGLDNPNQKAMPLLFFSETAKELGAKTVNLLAPYLGYMRQDKRFHDGESVTSSIFARFLSRHIDFLATIDPHLHRHKSLDEIYTIPNKVLHATDLVGTWIKENVTNPVLIGPDEESHQWVADIALKIDVPFLVLHKDRYGDKEVKVTVPKVDTYKRHTPVLVDDIISTARTMIDTVTHLSENGMNAPICIGIHAIFAEDAYDLLEKSGAQKIVTCNTIPHPSNGIDVSSLFKGLLSL